MPALTFAQKLFLQNRYGIILCHSHTDSGEPFYHFIKADRANIERLLQIQGSTDIIDFTAYGDIVLSGWGAEPTADDMAKLKELFSEES